MKVKVDNLSYIAGLFDGEGYFYIARSKVDKTHSIRPYRFQAYAGLTIREKAPLLLIKKNFGGIIRSLKSKNPKHSSVYKWLINGKELDNFLEKIKNYLLVKRNRAFIMQKFQTVKKEVGNKSITDSQYKKSKELWKKMKFYNKRGPK